MQSMDYDVIIAGGGVAGLTAAAAFGTAGFSTLIVDPAPPIVAEKDKGADLRTTAFLQPARLFLESAGLWPRLAPYATPLQTMAIVDASGEDLVTRSFDAGDISDDPFGWNLPNWLLRREMVARLQELDTVKFSPGVGFQRKLGRTDHIVVWLSDNTKVCAKLLIGADGRESPVRQAAGIGAQTTRYGQKALTFAVNHDAPHQNVSTEVHKTGGPFTLVPLPDRDGRPCSAVVWMNDSADVNRLQSVPDDQFNALATDRSGHVLGDLTLASRRTSWPIISQTADALIAERVALVAEAAHVMPPIGAQGLNMSLTDLATLLDLAKTDAELGGQRMLDTYQRKRHSDIKLRVSGVDILNRTSIGGSALIQDLRRFGLKALHDVPIMRRTAMTMGLGPTAKG